MTIGGLNFNCPRCNNPLFFTFKLSEAGDRLERLVSCPGCQTAWSAVVEIRPR